MRCVFVESGATAGAPSTHPYEHEINNFLYSEDQMTSCKERQPLSLELTPLTVVYVIITLVPLLRLHFIEQFPFVYFGISPMT